MRGGLSAPLVQIIRASGDHLGHQLPPHEGQMGLGYSDLSSMLFDTVHTGSWLFSDAWFVRMN